MPETRDELLDRYLSGEASPHDQSALMQAALDDPQLFDLLTTAGLVDGALRAGAAQPVMVATPRWSPGRKPLFWASGLAAAAAIAALIVFSVVRSPGPTARDQSPALTPSTAPGEPTTSVVAVNTSSLIFLSALLGDGGANTPPEFRAAPPADRLPRQEGAITTLAAGVAEVDLGSSDGLTNGSVLTVVSGAGAATPTGRLTVTRVFRDRARGEVQAGIPLSAGDRVRVDSADHLLAVAEQIGASLARGETKAAQALGDQALALVQSPTVRADARRSALAQLAALARGTGDLGAAARHLTATVHAFETRPAASATERAEVLNALGVVAAVRGDLAGAEEALVRAQSSAPTTGEMAVQLSNNLGAVAALRGDHARAEAFYQTAQELAGSESLRPAVDRNLATLRRGQ